MEEPGVIPGSTVTSDRTSTTGRPQREHPYQTGELGGMYSYG
jgi:hypothetical protein